MLSPAKINKRNRFILLTNHRIIIIEIDRIVNEQKMTQITTTELPQNLQTLFIEVERTKTPLTVIHEGKPLVIIYPATTQTSRPTFGVMKGSGEILGDLIAPVAEPWEVLQ